MNMTKKTDTTEQTPLERAEAEYERAKRACEADPACSVFLELEDSAMDAWCTDEQAEMEARGVDQMDDDVEVSREYLLIRAVRALEAIAVMINPSFLYTPETAATREWVKRKIASLDNLDNTYELDNLKQSWELFVRERKKAKRQKNA